MWSFRDTITYFAIKSDITQKVLISFDGIVSCKLHTGHNTICRAGFTFHPEPS